MAREPKNVAASVRAWLQDLARQQQASSQRVLTRYALERFLFRLNVSPHELRRSVPDCPRPTHRLQGQLGRWPDRVPNVPRKRDSAGETMDCWKQMQLRRSRSLSPTGFLPGNHPKRSISTMSTDHPPMVTPYRRHRVRANRLNASNGRASPVTVPFKVWSGQSTSVTGAPVSSMPSTSTAA